MSANNPNTTLYIKNLNDSVKKDELRAQLYALFLPYGRILDVVALKTSKMRGQAFVVFADLAAATTAMRSWNGEPFYDKPMHIEYAKSKSYATSKFENPDFIPPPQLLVNRPAEKRLRDEDDDAGPAAKRERKAEDDEEMEIEND